MDTNITTDSGNLFDIIFFWDNTRENIPYKQYCSETLCNLLGYNPDLSVKLVYEAAKNGKALIASTKDVEEATAIRNILTSMEMNCHITLTELSRRK